MKALFLTEVGKTEVREVPKPVPGPGEVLLKIGMVGFCGGDLNGFKGLFELQEYPNILGHEIGATIETAGPDVPLHISEMPKVLPVAEPKRSMVDYVKALGEVPTALVRGAVDPILANAYGIAKSIPQAIQTGQPPAPIGAQIARETMQKMQYQPTSPVTKDVLGAIGGALEETKLPPYMGNIGSEIWMYMWCEVKNKNE